MGELRHIREPIAGFLHSFGVSTKNGANPLMRRFRFTCDCGAFGPWRRDKDSAEEDGMAHQESDAVA